jgi:ferredoxin
MSLISQFKRLHKWIALVVGAQLVIWIISGLVFSFIDHQLVNGNSIYKAKQINEFEEAIDFASIIQRYPKATKIKQYSLLKKPVVIVSMQDTEVLYDIEKEIEVEISESLLRQIAELAYQGGGELSQMTLQTVRNDENRGMPLPVWQLNYDDQFSTHLYFSASTAQFLGVRTDHWRVFDFFIMLHFMDYADRGNFNTPLIIFFALVMFLFSISGMLLLSASFSVGDFSQLFYRFVGKRNYEVKVRMANSEHRIVSLTKGSRLLDGLAANNIDINSICGGGGTCGTCVVKINNDSKTLSYTQSEIATLGNDALEHRYRLACQVIVNEPLEVELNQ